MTKRDKTVSLSERLWNLTDMLSVGGKVVDVGCDHGFLDIYLVQTGKVSAAIAMDVRKGPLAACTHNVREAGLTGQIETRLSDGLAEFRIGEAEKLVCAGMGGPLMQRILMENPEKTKSFQEMILQPQSEIREFRAFLREQGYIITEERIILEDGKYYFPMKVVRGGTGNEDPCDVDLWEVYDRYGKALLLRKDPLLLRYLMEQKRIMESILTQLRANDPIQGEDNGSYGEGERAGCEKSAISDSAISEGTISNRERRLKEITMEWELLHKTLEMMR